ncbi:hypothetical protein GOP47_0002296 [Adiantum capillus-veneris]|uniref:Protein FLX-like 3 n=1 Tax=Adiantum capillus-veneris TaxID=13818 RepID=A0A9D4ZNY8_ADICA|nr:hypothetical protein GOP47_0002296 [Adiantum capillus-veneris]
MAGRGRLPPPMFPARGPIVGGGLRAGPGGFGPGIHPGLDSIPPQLLVEEKLATQHAEIQRLLTENQRLAATHVALRQELASAQQEVQKLQQVLGGVQAEKDQHFRALADRTSKMEAELRALEPLKVELQRAQTEAQKLAGSRQELSGQVQQLTQEMHRLRSDAQLLPSLKLEIDGFRQEIQRARTAFEFEKKANTELLEQRTAMEKNLVSMAREVEKLRAELTNFEKKTRTGGYGGAYGPESGYGSVPSYGEGYGMGQIGAGADNGAPFGTGAPPAWGGYEMQRGGARR